jgi:rod shape-determining protein MreD
MTMHKSIVPAGLIALAVIVCSLPWGVAPELRLVAPFVTYIVIHRCVERDGGATPDWLVFLAGFVTDIAGQGPLGYWALIYLCGYTMVRSATIEQKTSAFGRFLVLLVTIVTLSAMQWSLSSIYFTRAAAIPPILFAAGAGLFAYLTMLILLPIGGGGPARGNARLLRGEP